jgi:hypothetical protein
MSPTSKVRSNKLTLASPVRHIGLLAKDREEREGERERGRRNGKIRSRCDRTLHHDYPSLRSPSVAN